MFSLQSCPVLCHPMDCSLSGSPVHGILWARIVEWVAKSYSRGYYLPRDQTCNSFVSCIGRQLLYYYCHLDSVQFSWSVVSDSLRPHGLQHTRLHCPSPTLGACSNSCHRVSDAIQPSHPLFSPSPPAFNLSQHQGLFQWVSSSYQVAKGLEFQLQHQSFQWIFRTDFL